MLFNVKFISRYLYLSLSSKYSFAFILSSFNPPILSSISLIISFTLSRLSLALSNFLSAVVFLFLYITTPAASSNISLRLSAFVLTISEILPWPIIEYPSTPIPVSIINSLMSLSLHWLLFIRYSLSPDLYILLLIATSLYSIGKIPLELSITKVTSAIPLDFLSVVPAKITSSILPPRKSLGLCSPNTHLMASLILLLPLPFGPTIHVIPS